MSVTTGVEVDGDVVGTGDEVGNGVGACVGACVGAGVGAGGSGASVAPHIVLPSVQLPR